MKQRLIDDVVGEMLPFLNNAQAERLQEVLIHTLWKYEVSNSDTEVKEKEQDLVELFLSAKRIEGCSEKSLKYYQATIQAMLEELDKGIKEIVTEDIRCYLTSYQKRNHSSRVKVAVKVFVNFRLISLKMGNCFIGCHFPVSDCYSSDGEFKAQQNCIVRNDLNIVPCNCFSRELL